MSTKRKAMYHRMHNHEAFDGIEPEYAMRFLGIFARHRDRVQAHEGMAVELFANASNGGAQNEYMSNYQHKRFLPWIHPLAWRMPLVPSSCVTHRVLLKAVEELENLRQSTGQSVQDYYKELENKAEHLREAVINSALLQIFRHSLLPILSSVADQNCGIFTGPNALVDLRDFLASAQETHK